MFQYHSLANIVLEISVVDDIFIFIKRLGMSFSVGTYLWPERWINSCCLGLSHSFFTFILSTARGSSVWDVWRFSGYRSLTLRIYPSSASSFMRPLFIWFLSLLREYSSLTQWNPPVGKYCIIA